MSSESTELAVRAAGGEVSAFESLYRRELPMVYGLCLRMSGDENHAAELAQDVFVRAWSELGKFRGGSFSAWIFVLGRNVILNDRRTRSRFAKVVTFEDDVEAVEPPGPRVSHETALTIAAAVDGLPARGRAVFTLHDVEGYSAGEIGDLLGISAATVRVHLHRARRRIGEMLAP